MQYSQLLIQMIAKAHPPRNNGRKYRRCRSFVDFVSVVELGFTSNSLKLIGRGSECLGNWRNSLNRLCCGSATTLSIQTRPGVINDQKQNSQAKNISQKIAYLSEYLVRGEEDLYQIYCTDN